MVTLQQVCLRGKRSMQRPDAKDPTYRERERGSEHVAGKIGNSHRKKKKKLNEEGRGRQQIKSTAEGYRPNR